MSAVWRRELQSYFLTSIGYVYMGVFLALSGMMFYLMVLVPRSSDILMFLGQISFMWMLLAPVLTMRLLAEERQKKTDQLLLTSPVSQTAIVLGKYLAACTVLMITVVLSNVYILVVQLYGTVYPGEWFVGMTGFILQGCAFIALDLYLSGLMRNQVTACVAAFGVNLFLWILDLMSNAIISPGLSYTLSFFSLYKRYEPFLMGQLSLASMLFDICFIAFFLAATIAHIDVRRIKGV